MPETLIQLRLPEEEADALRQAGKAEGRSLPGEIRHRLQAYQSSDAVSRALQNLMLLVAEDASIFCHAPHGTGDDRAAFLGIIKHTMDTVLDALGAAEPKGGAVADMVAARLTYFLQQPEPVPREPAEVDSIRKTLAAGVTFPHAQHCVVAQSRYEGNQGGGTDMKSRRPRLSGFVRERGNSRSLVVRVDGQQYTKAVHTRTKKEALALLPAFVAEIQSGTYAAKREAERVRSTAPSFAEASEAFIMDYMRPASDQDGAASRRVYRQALARVAGEIGGNRTVSEITEPMLHRALRSMHEGGLSAGTVRTYRAVLSVFFRRMAKLGLVAASPVPPLGDLKLTQADPHLLGRHTALPREHVAALLQACASDPALKVWTTIMAATGARPGEALALCWQDVDLAHGTLRIAHSAKPGTARGQGRLGSTKTPGSVRTLPIGPALVAVLAAEKNRQEGVLRVLHGLGDGVASLTPLVRPADCVVPAALDSDAGRQVPVSPKGMSSRFKAAAQRAGLPAAHPHQLRHTAITAMVAGTDTRPGVSVVDAARLAGHSNPTITAKTYAHAVQVNLERGASLADDLIAPAAPAAVEPLRNAANGSSDR